MDAAELEQFIVLIKQSSRMTSRQYSTRMHEMVHNMSKALKSVQRWKRQVRRGVAGAFLFTERRRAESGGEYFVRDGMCVSLWQLEEAAEVADAALLPERLSR